VQLVRRYAAVAISLFAGLLCGFAVWAGYAGTSALMDSNAFCVSCHEMQTTADEFSHTVHFSNRTGVRASCADCHVPKAFIPRVLHMIGATGDIIGHLTGVIDTPAKFEADRLALAKRVWAEMKANNSRECRGCHAFEAMDAKLQRPEAVEAMHTSMADGKSCIDCHQGIAHEMPKAPTRPAPVPVAAATAPASPQVAAAPSSPPATEAPASPPPAAAPAAAGAQSFIGQAVVPLAAAPDGAAVATLYISAPVAVTGSEAGPTRITAKLWMKGDSASPGPMFAAPNGIELGRLTDPAAAKAKAGTATDGWVLVEIEGTVAADAIVADLAPVWQATEETYQFTCGACHDLHDPHDHTAAEWASEMPTMAKNANLQPADAMPILKWLQTQSLKPKAGN
jgi:trimethylamine-N-oxide reductase cytochrome c-type subunit TorC